MNLKINLFRCFLFCCTSTLFGQLDTYNYQRELKGVTDQWHQIQIPKTVFGKINPSMSDIRIYGITAINDTIEAPYILEKTKGVASHVAVPFKQINTVKTNAVKITQPGLPSKRITGYYP